MPNRIEGLLIDNDFDDEDLPAKLEYIALFLNTIASLLAMYGATLEREQIRQEKVNQQARNRRDSNLHKQMLEMTKETERLQRKMEQMQRQIDRMKR